MGTFHNKSPLLLADINDTITPQSTSRVRYTRFFLFYTCYKKYWRVWVSRLPSSSAVSKIKYNRMHVCWFYGMGVSVQGVAHSPVSKSNHRCPDLLGINFGDHLTSIICRIPYQCWVVPCLDINIDILVFPYIVPNGYHYMTTLSNGNILRDTGPLSRESNGHRWIPVTKASDVELWFFLWSAPGQRDEQTIETLVTRDAIAPIMTCYDSVMNSKSACTEPQQRKTKLEPCANCSVCAAYDPCVCIRT